MLGHWLMATVVVRDGHIIGANALTSIPALQLATWLLQVMPATLNFFGGVTGSVGPSQWEGSICFAVSSLCSNGAMFVLADELPVLLELELLELLPHALMARATTPRTTMLKRNRTRPVRDLREPFCLIA